VFQDADRNTELVSYETSRREDEEEAMAEDSNYSHLDSQSQANKIHKSKRQKRPPTNKKNDFLW
jgi:hypothetical protein